MLDRTTLADLDENSDARIARGLNWLAATQNAVGGFGSGGAAETAFAVLAITRWRPQWALTADCMRACEYLESKIASGEATETIWDEAVVLRVLVASDDAAMRGRALEQAAGLIARVVEPDARPHHLAQALLLAIAAKLPTAKLVSAVEKVDVAQLRDNPYARGQLLLAKTAAAIPQANWRDEERWLIAWVQKTNPTKGNFQDFCAAMVGLANTGTDQSSTVVRSRIDIIFSPVFQRPTDWSWYHFAWESSWALLALSTASSAARVELSIPDLLGLLKEAEEASDEIDAANIAYRTEVSGPALRAIGFWSAILGFVVAAAIALTSWFLFAGWDSPTVVGTLLGLWPVAIAVIAFCWNRINLLRKRLRQFLQPQVD
ncbi:hypothetical protein [Microbacterium aurum]